MIEKGQQIEILDHGYVKYIDSMGGDETIIDAARMSTKKSFISWDTYEECSSCGEVRLSGNKPFFENLDCPNHNMVAKPDGDLGLLEFLWKNHHATPFEMAELAIEVQAPIFVFREWHRHRTQSYNEMSARYTQMPDLHYVPDASRLKKNLSKNKQEASAGTGDLDLDEALGIIVTEQKEVYEAYERMIAGGVPKEVARINCPVARYSKMRAKTDLRNWLAFCNLRMRPDAMWEIRQYANAVGSVLGQLFPRTWEIWNEYTFHAVEFSRTEMVVLVDAINRMGLGTEEFRTASKAAGLKEKRVKELLSKLKIG